MSAILRQFILRRGAALNVLRLQKYSSPDISVHSSVTPSIIAQRSLSKKSDDEIKEPQDVVNSKMMVEEITKDVKPKIERSVYDQLVRSNKVVVFMKGTPRSPRCGFSNAVVQIFRMHGVDYDAHDVLADDDVREGIKNYTDWPTIPQVFINGEFIGGCDILLEMHQSGELVEQLGKAGIVSQLLRMEREVKEKKRKTFKNNTDENK